MTQETQLELFDARMEKLRKTLISKGNDYNGEDKLGALKFAALAAKITPEQVGIAVIAIKIYRLSNLTSSSESPNNESIDDNVLDLIGHSLCFDALIQESSCKSAK